MTPTRATTSGFHRRIFRIERFASRQVFRRREIVDARARPRHEVGYPVAPLMQAHIVLARDRTRDEAGFVQQLPEPVRVAGKVVTRQR